jgi:hypothetical protein
MDIFIHIIIELELPPGDKQVMDFPTYPTYPVNHILIAAQSTFKRRMPCQVNKSWFGS